MKYSKNFLKRFQAAIVALLVVATTLMPVPYAFQNAEAAGKNFSDVKTDDYFYEAVNDFTSRGIIQGYSDGSFRPYANVTRAQAAKLITKTLGLDVANIEIFVGDPGFNDVPFDSEYYQPIAILTAAGIIKGYGDQFKPSAPVTRAQISKMLSLAFSLQASGKELPFTDVKKGEEFTGYISSLFDNGITTGKTPTTFNPNGYVTRGQAAAFLYRSEAVMKQKTFVNLVDKDFVKIESLTLADIEEMGDPAIYKGMKFTIDIPKLREELGDVEYYATREGEEVTQNGTIDLFQLSEDDFPDGFSYEDVEEFYFLYGDDVYIGPWQEVVFYNSQWMPVGYVNIPTPELIVNENAFNDAE